MPLLDILVHSGGNGWVDIHYFSVDVQRITDIKQGMVERPIFLIIY